MNTYFSFFQIYQQDSGFKPMYYSADMDLKKHYIYQYKLQKHKILRSLENQDNVKWPANWNSGNKFTLSANTR